jgi:hypothetical protein
MRLVETTDDPFNPVPYGNERRYATRHPSPGEQQHGVIVGDPPRCHDCGAMPGGFHHAGCDYEECPRCYEPLLGCGCVPFEEEVEPIN